MPVEIYLNSKQRYDALFVDNYNKLRAGLGNNPSEAKLRQAALIAAESARLDALTFGLHELFSTIVTGGLAPD